METTANLATDVIVGAVIVALSLFMLLVWAVSEGLLTRARRRLEDRDGLAVSVGVLPPQPNPYLAMVERGRERGRS